MPGNNPPPIKSYEGIKLLADTAKWLAGIAMLMVASSPTLFASKLTGKIAIFYYLSILCMVVSTCASSAGLFNISGLVTRDERADTRDHHKIWDRIFTYLAWQILCFILGVILFGISVAIVATRA